ncbi:replicative helicase loader/inhibitor [Anaerosporobacter faecicola]|uniref:replicative helicase loader/inhibitor n=1 Tax=Anaerosporobacter faecicola TaxID=2718714 RepID=UPI00143B1089|nr:replicative helicase loader/inhibitor [Anaerosporobacter faecicola]
MIRQEVVKILMIISSAFPNFKSDNMSNTADVWATLLADYDYNVIQASLMTYIASSNSSFAPSVSQLIAGTRTVTGLEGKYENEEEAWSLVYKAICKSTYYSVEEFNKLPALCQKAIGSPDNLRELAKSDVSVLQSVEKSLFVKTYRNELARQQQHDLIPISVKQQFGLADKYCKQLAIEQHEEQHRGPVNRDMQESTIKALEDIKNGYWEE